MTFGMQLRNFVYNSPLWRIPSFTFLHFFVEFVLAISYQKKPQYTSHINMSNALNIMSTPDDIQFLRTLLISTQRNWIWAL